MSNKLQNIKALKQLLAGEHKTQTRKTFSFGSGEDSKIVEERFEDGTPKVWIETDTNGNRFRITQNEGYRTKRPVNSTLDIVKETLSVPDSCPSCGKKMRDHEQRLNFKFYFMRGKCFECVLVEERKIKAEGPEAWERYEKQIMLDNAEAWFKDTDKEFEVLKASTIETLWANAEGDSKEADISAFIEKMENDYVKLKDDIRKDLNIDATGQGHKE
jgi:hypothetical protein